MVSKKAEAQKSPRRPRVRRGNQEDAQRLRQALIEAAADIAAEQGARAVSIRAVAARVGVSPMATYRYFADRSDLLSGIWEQMLQSLMTAWRARLSGLRGARVRQRAFVETFIRFWLERPDHYALLYGFSEVGRTHVDRRPVSGTTLYAEMLALQDSLTAELADALGTDMRHAQRAADVRHAMALGYLHGTQVVTGYPWGDPGPLLERYLDLVVDAVARCLTDEGGTVPRPKGRAAQAPA